MLWSYENTQVITKRKYKDLYYIKSLSYTLKPTETVLIFLYSPLFYSLNLNTSAQFKGRHLVNGDANQVKSMGSLKDNDVKTAVQKC